MQSTISSKKETYIRREKFLDLDLDIFAWKDWEKVIDSLSPGSQIISLNAEQTVLAYENPHLMEIFKNAELIIPDGSGVVLAMNFFLARKNHELISNESHAKVLKIEKIAGVELAEKLIHKYKRVALFGSTQEIIELLKNKYEEKIVFAKNGYFDFKEVDQKEEIVKKILASNADILLVALGSPMQEEFIFEYKTELKKLIAMGVGGGLEVLSGKQKRAPRVFINCHLEWLFRLIIDPLRLVRILTRFPKFIVLVFRQVLKNR